jgi:hypothetical protein
MKNRLITERNAEDNKDVLFIMQNFKTEGVSKERLKVILFKGKDYENRCYEKGLSGNRGNRNMIKACELLLADESQSTV